MGYWAWRDHRQKKVGKKERGHERFGEGGKNRLASAYEGVRGG